MERSSEVVARAPADADLPQRAELLGHRDALTAMVAPISRAEVTSALCQARRAGGRYLAGQSEVEFDDPGRRASRRCEAGVAGTGVVDRDALVPGVRGQPAAAGSRRRGRARSARDQPAPGPATATVLPVRETSRSPGKVHPEEHARRQLVEVAQGPAPRRVRARPSGRRAQRRMNHRPGAARRLPGAPGQRLVPHHGAIVQVLDGWGQASAARQARARRRSARRVPSAVFASRRSAAEHASSSAGSTALGCCRGRCRARAPNRLRTRSTTSV